MLVKINSLNKQIEAKDLEGFTRKLYVYRQKDRPKDERGNGSWLVRTDEMANKKGGF